jgi:hypothetical protein
MTLQYPSFCIVRHLSCKNITTVVSTQETPVLQKTFFYLATTHVNTNYAHSHKRAYAIVQKLINDKMKFLSLLLLQSEDYAELDVSCPTRKSVKSSVIRQPCQNWISLLRTGLYFTRVFVKIQYTACIYVFYIQLTNHQFMPDGLRVGLFLSVPFLLPLYLSLQSTKYVTGTNLAPNILPWPWR